MVKLHNSVCEIFTYQEGQAKQLSFNSVRTYAPLVSESFVVYNVYDGVDFDIYIYDGVSTLRFTDNDLDDTLYDISGNTFVWTQRDRTHSQIFMATYVVPEPTSLMLLVCGAIMMKLHKLRPVPLANNHKQEASRNTGRASEFCVTQRSSVPAGKP